MPDGADPIWGESIQAEFSIRRPAISCETGGWDENAIPPRDWVARGYYLRGAVTVVIGPGGVSKSTPADCSRSRSALGRPVHGMHPVAPCRVMILNVEDDHHEQRRRLSAVLTSMGRTPADIAGRIARVMPTGTGTLLTRNPDPDPGHARADEGDRGLSTRRAHP